MADIVMPQLGETVTEGTITKWLKSIGDPVAQDEPLFEVSTDKVDSEVPSSSAGTLAQILVQEGETVDVGVTLAVISNSGSPVAAAPAAAPLAVTPPAAVSPAAAAPPEHAPPVEVAPAPAPAPVAQPEQIATTAAGATTPVPAQATFAVDPPAANPAPAPAAMPASGDHPGLLLSPVVRRLIHDNGLDPSWIVGTGAGGRITREDVLSVIDTRSAGGTGGASGATPPATPPSAPGAAPSASSSPSPTPAPATPAPATPAPATPAPAPAPTPAPPAAPIAAATSIASASASRSGDEVISFSNIRRRTAEHMVRSKATSPHAMVSMEVDFESVDTVRTAHGPSFKTEEGFSLTYLPFLLVATVEALRSWPNINASVGEDVLIVHHDLHIGIAVDLDTEGLIVPVIHNADSLRLRALAHSVRDLAERARTKKLTADDISGGTFTITNPGPFGTLLTFPIINQPQVAILSTDGVRRRPVAVELPDGTEAITVHSVGNLALAFDHRVVDGAYASHFLKEMKTIIESRDWAQEL